MKSLKNEPFIFAYSTFPSILLAPSHTVRIRNRSGSPVNAASSYKAEDIRLATSVTMPPTIALFLLSVASVSAKVYDRCELARELKYVHEVPSHEVATWVCIVAHESIYNTAAMNPGSGDHGLFQISQLYWCSPPGDGFGCNAPCSAFRDDNIADDVKCVRRIFKEHKRISGDGFNAWAVYPLYCKGDKGRYVKGCFDNDIDNSISVGEAEVPINTSSTEKPYSEEDDDEGYEFPPLPSPPKKTLENTISSNEDVYDFPPLPTTQRTLGDRFQAEKSLKLIPNFIEPAFVRNVEPSFFTVTSTTPFPTKLITTWSPYPIVTTLSSRPSTKISTLAPFTEKLTTLYKTSTSAFVTKVPYSTKPLTATTTYIQPKQITYKPFSRRPNVTVTLRPVIRPPRPPPPPRPLLPRPTIRPTHQRRSRPTLRPFSRFTTVAPKKNSVFFSTTSFLYPTQIIGINDRTSTIPEISFSETKNIYSFSTPTPKSTSTKQSTVTISSTTTQPLPTSVGNSQTESKGFKSEVKMTGKVSVLKMSTSPKPLSSSASNFGNNGNSLKREERRYDNVFPGYYFSRIGNGFRLVQML